MNEQRFRIVLLNEGGTLLTCQEAGCQQYAKGWLSLIDETTDLGRQQAAYIRRECGRRFVEFPSEDAEEHLPEGTAVPAGLTVFKFEPGQKCFRQHLDREVVFLHEKGDQRRVHRPVDFNEHMNEEAARVSRTIERG